MQFRVVAIPLSRPPVVKFLEGVGPRPRGEKVWIVGQRPTPEAEARWARWLGKEGNVGLGHLLRLDAPRHHLVQRATDRLVPVSFLKEPGFLTRNLGGWAPIYFGVVGAPAELSWEADPLLAQAEFLGDHGATIRYFGADPALVAGRLGGETGQGMAGLAAAWRKIFDWRGQVGAGPGASTGALAGYVDMLFEEAVASSDAAPRLLLLDELLGQMVRLEQARRAAEARQDQKAEEEIAALQARWREEAGLSLILKGEYIMGRHRRSTVLIARSLGRVVKQPAPEPFHEIQLAAREVDGRAENWPYLTENGALVTSRGRLRLILEEDVVPRLNRVFGHDVLFSSLLGLIVEPYISGPTTQEYVLADPRRLTADLYEVYVLHQQVCEFLAVENGDWHSANFIMREDGTLVHIDWGAARPLRGGEEAPEGVRARLDQVRNIGFSFHDDALARRVQQLHAELLADGERMESLRARAQALIDAAAL